MNDQSQNNAMFNIYQVGHMRCPCCGKLWTFGKTMAESYPSCACAHNAFDRTTQAYSDQMGSGSMRHSP